MQNLGYFWMQINIFFPFRSVQLTGLKVLEEQDASDASKTMNASVRNKDLNVSMGLVPSVSGLRC